jgi:hypothetical protein
MGVCRIARSNSDSWWYSVQRSARLCTAATLRPAASCCTLKLR